MSAVSSNEKSFPKLLGAESNMALMHQVLVAYNANHRVNTAKQKTRSEVKGSGAKPWRQKGTGHARAGTKKSPIWRTGGRTFSSHLRDYSKKVNRKMYRKAISIILSDLNREESLVVVDKIDVAEAKTKLMVQYLENLIGKKSERMSCLLIIEQVEPELQLACRNLPYVHMCLSTEVNPYALLAHDCVVATKTALTKLEEIGNA